MYGQLWLVKTGPLQDWSRLVQNWSRDHLDQFWSCSLPKKVKDQIGLDFQTLTSNYMSTQLLLVGSGYGMGLHGD